MKIDPVGSKKSLDTTETTDRQFRTDAECSKRVLHDCLRGRVLDQSNAVRWRWLVSKGVLPLRGGRVMGGADFLPTPSLEIHSPMDLTCQRFIRRFRSPR